MLLDELKTLREKVRRDIQGRWGMKKDVRRRDILVCAGGACISSGEESVRDALTRGIEEHGCAEENRVVEVGCVGLCDLGPVVIVRPEGTFYQKVTAEDARRIVEED